MKWYNRFNHLEESARASAEAAKRSAEECIKDKAKPTFRDYVISKHGSYPPCKEPGVPYDVTVQALADCFAEWVEM